MLTAKHLTYAKAAIQLVTGMGVTKIVHDIIDNNVGAAESTFDSVRDWAGAAVISSIVAERAHSHIDTKIDKFAAWCEKTKATADAK